MVAFGLITGQVSLVQPESQVINRGFCDYFDARPVAIRCELLNDGLLFVQK